MGTSLAPSSPHFTSLFGHLFVARPPPLRLAVLCQRQGKHGLHLRVGGGQRSRFFPSRPGVNFLSRPVCDPEHSLPHSDPTSPFQAAPPSGPSSGWSRPAQGRHAASQGSRGSAGGGPPGLRETPRRKTRKLLLFYLLLKIPIQIKFDWLIDYKLEAYSSFLFEKLWWQCWKK